MSDEDYEEVNNKNSVIDEKGEKKNISEEEYENLKNMISEYFKLEEIIKDHNKKIAEFKKNKTLIFSNIYASMVENDIEELETNDHLLQLVNVKKIKSITEETLQNGILTSIKEIDKTPEEYGINKVVELIVNSINNERKVEEVKELKIKKKKGKGKEKKQKKQKNNNKNIIPKKSSSIKKQNIDEND